MSGESADPGQAGVETPTYHVEVRQFPHNVCRFNLSEQELRVSVVEPWAREQWIELGDRKWSPHQAKLTVIEGAPIPVEQLSLGRGWRAAQRQGRNVTTHVLAAARGAAVEGGAQTSPSLAGQAPEARDEGLMADSLGLELLALLGDERAPLRRSWELAQARYPERSAGECLTLAERAVASLLQSRLVVLVWRDSAAGAPRQVEEAQTQAVLRAIDSWAEGPSSTLESIAPVWICRA